MKRVRKMLFAASVLMSSCQKENVVPAYGREKPHQPLLNRPVLPDLPGWPLRPDTMLMPRFPRLPRVPLPLSLNRCIYSYQDVVDALGTNRLQARAVILDGGPLGDITLERSADLPGIWYTAVDQPQGSSLFRSQLQVEWRPDPSVYFSGFSADVWSLGCVYDNTPFAASVVAAGGFTNILKGGVEVKINTCFFWSAAPYQHVRVKYIVVE